MPLATARTEVAVIVPLAAFVPDTTTVSPVCSPASGVEAVRVVDTNGPTVTLTRAPVESVTYSVLPCTPVTMPAVAEPPPAPPNSPPAPVPVPAPAAPVRPVAPAPNRLAIAAARGAGAR